MLSKEIEDKYIEYIDLHYSNLNTRKQYIDVFKRFSKLNNEVNQEAINKYLSRFSNNPLNRSALKSIGKCFSKEIEIPKQHSRKGKKIYKFLTKEEIDYLIERTTPKTSLMIRIFFETGLRLSELLNTKREQINLANRTISGIGKGQKEFEEKFSQTTANLIEIFINENQEEYPFKYEDIIHNDKKFWRILKKESERLGIPNVHPHRIRHSLGHYLTQKGWNLQEIKEKLRHEKITSTSIYAVATKEAVEKKMEQEVFKNDNVDLEQNK